MAGKVLSIDKDFLRGETVLAVSSVVKAGGTVIYPSDTVYGILADSGSRIACSKVATMKGYPEIRPFIVLVPEIKTALSLIATGEKTHSIKADAAQLMQNYWPGPVTLVFKASTGVPGWLISEQGTVALRLPGDTISLAILKESGKCLISTSANLKGQPFPLSVQEINEEITSSVDLTLNSGRLSSRKPSKVIDCTGDVPVELRG